MTRPGHCGGWLTGLHSIRQAGPPRIRAACHALVAQWIEHRSSEPRVGGSNPSECTLGADRDAAFALYHKLMAARSLDAFRQLQKLASDKNLKLVRLAEMIGTAYEAMQ